MNDAENQPPASDTTPGRPPDVPPVPPAGRSDGRRAPSPPRLQDALAEVRRRAAGLAATRDVLLGAAAAGAVLFVTVLLLVARQSWARPAGWALGGLALAAGLGLALFRAFQLRRDDRAAARALGQAYPGRASDLLSAVELARAAQAAEETGASPALVRAHLERMDRLAPALEPRLAVPLRPVALALAAAVAVGALHGALSRWGGERVARAYAFLAFRSAEGAPLFVAEPIAGDITLTYRYPAHTGRPPHTVAGTAGDIAAPKGTLVDLSARADRDVALAFALVNDTVVPLSVQGRTLSGRILITDPGEWRLRYATDSGRVVAEGPPRPVILEPDLFPEVKITAPEEELEVDPGQAVEVSFSASDDYGLSGMELVFSLGRGEDEARRPLGSWTPALRRHQGSFTWDLSTLQLRPGDRVTFYVEATDNDAVSGPKKGVSPSRVLRVFSATEHNQQVLRRAEEQWERLLAGLGDRLVEPGGGEKGERGRDREWEKQTTTRDQALASVVGDMRNLARELSADTRAPPEIGRALAHVAARVGAAVQKTTASRRSFLQRPSPAGSRQLGLALGGEIDEEEKGVLYLEDLMDRRRLLDLAELTRELQAGRRELSALVEKHRQAPDESTRRAILAEVSRLKQRMHELFKRMRELAKEIQDQHANRDAEQMLEQGDDLLSQLDEVQRQLSRGDDAKALEALESLQKQLEQMERQFSDSAGETTDEQREVGRKLQQIASELLDVEAEQEAVRKETDALRQKEREALKQKMEKMKKEFVQRQRERVAKAREELRAIDPLIVERLHQEEDLQAALERLAQLDTALQLGDFDEARQQVDQALQVAFGLKNRLATERELAQRIPSFAPSRPELDAAAGRADRAERPLQDVARDLENLLQSARQTFGEDERRQMQKLAERQESVRQRTDKLQQQLDQIGEQMPVFGPEQGNLLRDAAGQMGEARGQLGESNPRGATQRQQEALEKLSQFRESMRQGGQGSQGGGIPMPFGPSGEGEEGEGQGVRQQRVEIPSVDQSRAPEEFRRDILDAMKDETPERYRERVRDYYEELVK